MAALVWFVVCCVAGYLAGDAVDGATGNLALAIVAGILVAVVCWFLGIAIFLDGDW